MVYKDELIGKFVEIDGEKIEITEKLIELSENKLAGQKKALFKKRGDPDQKLTYDSIIREHITAEDVLRNIPSVIGLNDKLKRQSGEKPAEVKFEDVRNMDLGLANLSGYTDSEKNFINQRLPEYEKDYDIEKAADKFKALRAIVCEMKILQLEILLSSKLKGDPEIQKQIDALDKQHAFHCDGLNVLKKQRDNAKAKPVDDTISISKLINDMSKPIDELQKEADELKQKKEKFLKERGKRK